MIASLFPQLTNSGKRWIILISIVSLSLVTSGQTTFTRTLAANESWTTAVWTKTGTPTAATYPGQVGGETHIVVINCTGNNATGRTLTLDINITQSVSSVSVSYSGTRTCTLAIGNNTLTMSGDLSGNGIITMGSGILNIAGNNNQTGTFTCGTGTVNYNSGSAQSVRGTTYNNIIFTNAGVKTLAANANIGGNLTIQTSATLDLSSFTANRSAAGGTLSIDATGTLLIGGTNSFPSNYTNNTFTAGSTVNYDGASQNITALNYSNLTLSGSGTKSLQGNITPTGNLTVSNCTLDLNTFAANRSAAGGTLSIDATGTLLIGGTNSFPANYTTNTFTAGSTVNYDGAGQNIAALNYSNLTLSSSGTKSLLGNITPTGNLTISNCTLDLNTFTANRSSAGGTLSIDATGTLLIGGTNSFPSNYTTNTFTAGSTVNYDGASQNITALNYSNLTLSGSGTKSLQGNITPTGNLTVSNCTLDLNTFTANRGSAGGAISIDGTGVLLIGGTNSFPTNYTTKTLSAGSVVNYDGTAQTVGINTYSNLTLSGSGVKTFPAGTTTVNGTLSMEGTATTAVTGTLTYAGGATLQYQGSAAQISGTELPASISNLTINNSLGVNLTSDVSVNSVLTLTRGIVTVNATRTLRIGSAAGVITGGSATEYIDGTLSRVMNNGTTYAFPVGKAACGFHQLTFSNLNISAGTEMKVTFSCTGATTGDASIVTPMTVNINWYLEKVAGTFTDATVKLDGSEIDLTKTIAQSSLQAGQYSKIVSIPASGSVTATSIGTIVTDKWLGIGTPSSMTYYSYQSGDWNLASTWTIDPSGTNSINPGVPGALDDVVILNGRTVTLNTNNKVVHSLELNLGGNLDLTTTSGHDFGTVTGQGVLKLSSGTFPAGTFTTFVAAGGGTVEYYNLNGTGISSTQLIYNNLIISNNTSNIYSVFLNNATNPINYTLNGNFDLKNNSTGSLMFYFGNSTPSDNLINMTVYGNFTINPGCNVRVNNFASSHTIPNPNNSTTAYPIHSLHLYGDFTNNGSARFTGLPSPFNNAYYLIGTTAFPVGGTNYGDVQVFFEGASNNKVTCNGITDFFRLIVSKGTDQTYMLDIVSSNINNFALYAPNNQGNNVFNGGTDGYGWGTYYKALYIKYGTLKLGANINIPSLTEGGQDFNLISTAAIWVNGANVSTTVPGVNGTGYQAATLYGRLQISAGQFSTGDAAGIVLGTLGTPEIFIEGTGTLDVSQTWASAGTNQMSYTQTGGTANIRLQGENHAGPMLGLSSTNTVFKMSGGSLNFRYNTFAGGATDYQIMDIQAQTGNYQVTGGTVNLDLPSSATVYTANSTVPFYNLNITNKTGTGTTTIQWNTPSSNLTVLNDLTIGPNAVLNLGTSNIDLNIGHNFNLVAGGTYTPGNNTTTFNGTGGQIFANSGTITSGLNNYILSNSSNTNISGSLTIRGNLTISNKDCYLNDQGNSINVAGNILNSGTHTSQANGSIILNGTVAQTIGGDGNGIFGNLTLNNSAGNVSFTANQTVNGNLRLANGILNINQYSLTLSAGSYVYDALAGTTAAFSNSKMIITNGLQSDGGVSKVYSAAAPSFIFPVGSAGGYHPATIGFSASPATWGSVNVKPVAKIQPVLTSANALKYYWKVTGSGFTGIQTGSVSHLYHFINPADINAGTLTNYIPGVYNPYSWTIINDVSQVDKINYNVKFTSVSYIDGDYTAGEPGAFSIVKVYYSRQTGNWNDINTWSSVSNSGSPDGTLPGANNPVVIGDGITNNHTVTIPVGNNNLTVGGLQINSGSVLDITTTTGHNFGALPNQKVTGAGTLRISSTTNPAVFPAGDFGNFLNAGGGTVDYYSTTTLGIATFVLPATYNAGGTTVNITCYNNLMLSPFTGKNIILPNTDLTIFGNLAINGTTTGLAQFNIANSTHTVIVNGTVNINSGKLEYFNTNASAQNNMITSGDINISNGAAFDVAATNSATSNLSIQGNLINNGTFNMRVGTPCNVTFTGGQNKGISGTGAITNFNILIVNKGTDRNSVLDVTSTAFSLNAALSTALTLTNGTFRLTSPLPITLTTTAVFTIPASGCLSANGGTINIGQANNNAADLMLQGRLEVLAGAVNIGNGSGSNNDIEYAPAGNPEIIVAGGTLRVDGQVRRNLTNTLGSLWYSQSGGTVTVRGLGFNNTRGMFEVTNSGSHFNMSGSGVLNIERAGILTYADVYIVPDNYNVTGGTVQLGNTNTPATNVDFKLNASCPLGNLVVDGTTRSKSVTLSVNPLTLVYDLTINSSGSFFNSNGLNLTIGRNFTNNNSGTTGFVPGSLTQTTTFNGTSASIITGTSGNLTIFSNFVNTSTSTVSLGSNSNIAINANMTLNSGTLADGGNIIMVYGNVENNATHTSTGINGITLGGTVNQVISGSGTGIFGNIAINNAQGVDMVDNTTINGRLTFINGSININDLLLTLGESVSIAGTPDATKMIVTNGTLSDEGVRKLFPASAYDFTFPVGVAGKYTPARFNVTSNAGGTGTIRVKPVNDKHPALADAITNELSYYWYVDTTGFAGAHTVQHTYTFIPADMAMPTTGYLAGRYINGAWVPAGGITGSVINPTNFTLPPAGVSYISGEYTAGAATNFAATSRYYSRQSGSWETPATWFLDSPTGPTIASVPPNGNQVFIQNSDIVTITANNKVAYSVDIADNATLDISNTTFHDIGHVSGGGTIIVTSTSDGMFVFPGGDYDNFMANSHSTIVFNNPNTSIPATMPLKPGNFYKPFQNIVFTGAGTKYITAENLKVLGNLTISGGTLSDVLFNKNIYIYGNWTDNTPAGGFAPGEGLVSFEGSINQQITVTGNVTENFYNFLINNSLGVTLNSAGAGNVNVSNLLYLTNGKITTNTTNTFTLTNTGPSVVIGGGSGSFVDGPLYKAINSGSYFNFPVGNGSRYGNINISSVNTSAIYVAQYFNSQSTYDVTKMLAPVTWVSNNEYWWLSSSAASNGIVTLRWDGLSFDSSFDRTKLRVVSWNPSGSPNPQWESQGSIITDGGTASGTIQTSNAIDLSPLPNQHYLTIGTEGKPTATILSPTYSTSICNDATSVATVSVKLTGTAPWSLSYTLNSVPTTLTNQASSPVSIAITSASNGINNTPGIYNFKLTGITDKNGTTGNVDTNTVRITVKPVPSPSISGRTTVGTSENGVAYSTPSVGGNTYAWVVTGGTIATGAGTAAITVNWNSTPGTGTVQVTETNGAPNNCSIIRIINVTKVNAPTPNVTGNNNVCANATGEIYSTPNIAGHTYVWTVTGGTFTGPTVVGGNNQIIVAWGAAGPGSVRVDETYGSTISSTLSVSINALPSTAPAVANQVICSGFNATLQITGAEGASDYYLYNGATLIVTVHTTTAGNYSFPAFSPASTTTYTVRVINQYGCSANLVSQPTVTVNSAPSITVQPVAPPTVCSGNGIQTISVTATGPGLTYSWRKGGVAVVNVGVITGQGTSTLTLTNPTSANAGSYDVVVSGTCAPPATSTTVTVTVNSSRVWNGSLGTDWNTAGNWSCGTVPDLSNPVQIPNVANKPILSSGAAGAAQSIVIDIGSSLTVVGNTIQIAGSITNNGTFDATAGTVEMNGTLSQNIAANVFTGNTIKDLIINNPAGVTLAGPLGISGVLKVQNGDLSSGGNLTLLSTAVQTALVDGSGSGNITGNVTMQRYLQSGFGYKYFSSPFTAATVNEFTNELITLLYRYDENRLVSGLPATGWVNYKLPANVLNPLSGYAVNFGSSSNPLTVDITGVVNNGNMSVTLYNNNQIYTQGFNLVGNPYPSPIDWNAAGWTKTNIDDALYFFKASTTDQYGGTYRTYINGISSDGIVNNIIPSMQGFFVHVSNGSFPVTATMSLNNNTRITNLSQPFTKSGSSNYLQFLRLGAAFSDDTLSADPMVIYFDGKATPDFDGELDALKLLNTDLRIPNLYGTVNGAIKLSISALPEMEADSCIVPLGLKLNRAGNIVFKILDIDNSLAGYKIYLRDLAAGTQKDLMPDKEYSVFLDKGEYNNRFLLDFLGNSTGSEYLPGNDDKFSIYNSKGILKAEIGILNGTEGTVRIFNLPGQIILIENVFAKGHYEFSTNLKDGIYIVNYSTGTYKCSKKLFIQNR